MTKCSVAARSASVSRSGFVSITTIFRILNNLREVVKRHARDRRSRWSAARSSSICGRTSQIDDDVAKRLCAAHEQIALGGLVERLRCVDDRAQTKRQLEDVLV